MTETFNLASFRISREECVGEKGDRRKETIFCKNGVLRVYRTVDANAWRDMVTIDIYKGEYSVSISLDRKNAQDLIKMIKEEIEGELFVP